MEDNKNQNETTRSGFVTLIGRPNVGKSTLMNHLIGQKIAITSKKPQTTRNRIRTVYTDERGQIVFLDTPGMHKVKNKLGTYMEDVVLKTIKEVDLILWLVEPTTYVGAGEQEIVKLLKQLKVPVLLGINKTDTIQKEEITQVLATYNSLMNYAGVVCVSALKDKGVDDVLAAIFEHLPYGPMLYDEETVTDQTMRQIAAEMIREQALRLLSDEIPHGIAVEIDRMKERNDSLTDIDATIICER
ncbi:MAG: GTPase Era, partial [Lachnospiraceae bacterium]|nr:GTPase Era [Lachnospiraceae bacterium]